MEWQMCSCVLLADNNTACHKTTNLKAQMYVNKNMQVFQTEVGHNGLILAHHCSGHCQW